MSLINKIKKHGILGSLKIVEVKVSNMINHLLFNICKVYPIDEKMIVMESEGDLSDNAFALFDYMLNNGYLETYRIVWLVDDVKKALKKNYPNTSFVIKQPTHIDFKRAKSLATCKWYIYDHCNLMSLYKKRKEQKIIYLSHGAGFKASKGRQAKIVSDYDIMTATGPLAAESLSKFWNRDKSNCIITGYPRIDYFFNKDHTIQKEIERKWQFDKYDKKIFWMPTFRQSINASLSEDYIQNSTGLPIFATLNDLKIFDGFLNQNNILMIFKLHHLQANLDIFKYKFRNIKIVHDEDLDAMNIQLYQFISYSDALITDYSSISQDYLILNKPIIFTLDDYNEYNNSRGLEPSNAIDYMKGYHVFNQNEIRDALLEIKAGIDKYANDRKNIFKYYHTYCDGNSSLRVLNAVGIQKEN